MNTPSHTTLRKLNWMHPLLVLSLLVTFCVTGCRPSEEEVSKKTSKSEQDKQKLEASLQATEQCEKWLNSAIHMSDPEEYAINVESKVVLGLLNDWASICGNTKGNVNRDGLKSWLDEELITTLDEDRFLKSDALHLRNSILFHQIWEKVATGSETNLERVRKAFDFVINNVADITQIRQASGIALKPHEVLIWGMGTAEDRALIFVELLRQNRIDSCIIRPKSSADAKKPWFVGVLLDEGIYLFSTEMGIPLPGPKDDPADYLISDVATLKQVKADDSLLRKLDVDEETPFPLTATDLKEIEVEMVGYPELWQNRFRVLQSQLPSEHHFLLYDGLVDDKNGQGLSTRLVSQSKGLFDTDNLSLWNYPAKQIEKRNQMTQDQLRFFNLFGNSFITYLESEVKDLELVTAPTHAVGRARLAYISGKHQLAIKKMVAIQMLMRGNVEGSNSSIATLRQYQKTELVAISMTALDNILYWMSIAQMQLGKYEYASNRLNDYLSQTKGGGLWGIAAAERLMTCYSLSGKPAIAVQLAKRLTEQAPEDSLKKFSYQLSLKRIRALQAKQTKTPEK